MKKSSEEPVAEIYRFESEDVLTTSGAGGAELPIM